ncbi:MAG: terminase family protein [Caulobacterales bacterium]|nr:terminase family protein [Caulobacterales bacterium]
MRRLSASWLAGPGARARGLFLASLDRVEARALSWLWSFWSRRDQEAPDAPWRTWVLLGGRGAGKTRAGAEWVRAKAEHGPLAERGRGLRVALVGAALADVREVMIEGPSGLRAVAPPETRPSYEASRRRLIWPNGSVAYAFSAEDPDSLRGPQFDVAWCDEFCAWREPEQVFAMLAFGLRLGARPQAVVTTTPRPGRALGSLLEAADTVVTRAGTRANAAWLSSAFLQAMESAFAGTRLGRQELDGEVLEDVEGALWTRDLIERAYESAPPALKRIVIGVDPPASVGPKADACGIIVVGAVGEGRERRAYVLADRTVQGVSPERWARRVADAAQAFEADRIVAEVNQGGSLVRSVLEVAEPGLPVREVRASRGKAARAEPVAALYERGRVRHAGRFPALEDEMCAFGAPGETKSPDRVDALVWAVSELMFGGGAPRLRHL